MSDSDLNYNSYRLNTKKHTCRRNRKSMQQRRKMKTRHRDDDMPYCSSSVESVFEYDLSGLDHFDEEKYLLDLISHSEPDEIEYDVRIVPIADSSNSEHGHRVHPITGQVYCDNVLFTNNSHSYANNADGGFYNYSDDGSEVEMPSILQNQYLRAMGVSIYSFVSDQAKNLAMYLAEKPTVMALLIIVILMYLVFLTFELSVVLIIEPIARFVFPNLHHLLVVLESCAGTVARWFNRADHLSQAFFCDFADTWCARFDSMCDKRCSHMDIAVQKLRNGDL